MEETKTGDIFKVISAVMADVGAIGKTRKNTQPGQGGYTFRGIDDVYNALQAPMVKHGLVVIPDVLSREASEHTTKSGGTLFFTVMTIKFTFYAVSDGSSISATVVGEAMDSGDKSAGKAQSYGMKVAMLQVFCVPTEGDNDTENQTHEVKSKAKPPAEAVNKQTGEVAPMSDADKEKAAQHEFIVAWDAAVLARGGDKKRGRDLLVDSMGKMKAANTPPTPGERRDLMMSRLADGSLDSWIRLPVEPKK